MENRPGLEEPTHQLLFAEINKSGATSLTLDDASDVATRDKLLLWLSDWHLLSFLGSCGLVSEADMQVFVKVGSAPSPDDPTVLDPLLLTDSWQTLTTFAREHARTSLSLLLIVLHELIPR